VSSYKDADQKLILLQSVFQCPQKNQLCRQEANGCVRCLSEHLSELANDLDDNKLDLSREVDDLSEDELNDWRERFDAVFDSNVSARVLCWKRAVFYDHPDNEQSGA
jgi:elongation factor P--beta-lysine ligase